MEETQRVRLQNLRQAKNAPQFFRRGWNAHGKQLIASLGGSDQMAYWTDPANPGHQGRHFVEWPAFAELLEAAKLSNVKARIFHSPLFIQMQCDFGMALDAGYWVDENRS